MNSVPPENSSSAMQDPDKISLYQQLLEANQLAFDGDSFIVAYHSLCGALYCALELKDKDRLLEVQTIVQRQQEELTSQWGEVPPVPEPIELSLYISLSQIVRTRLLLHS